MAQNPTIQMTEINTQKEWKNLLSLQTNIQVTEKKKLVNKTKFSNFKAPLSFIFLLSPQYTTK